MMRVSLSSWRPRAVARLLLARRAVARRTERAGAGDRSRAAIVDVDRLFWWLGVFERAPCALGELTSVVLVGGYVGRQALDEHDLGVA